MISRVEWDSVKKRLAEIAACLAILAFGAWLAYTSNTPPITTIPTIESHPVTVISDCADEAGVKVSSSPVKMAALGTIVDPLVFATGVSGAYTVPRGYVVGLSAIASTNPDGGLDSGGVGATVTITPNGPNITDGAAVTQPPILIPAGYNWSIGRPVIQGNANEMGTGTTIVFYGTQTYTVVMSLGGS
jgi:hypothetical protein